MNPDDAWLAPQPLVPGTKPEPEPTAGRAFPVPWSTMWWPTGDAGQRPSLGGAPGHDGSIAQRMAALHAWEFHNVPMLRRRASAEVFFAVWALAGPDHDATFTAKAVLAHARISDRAARFALKALLEEGWIQRSRNVRGDADGRLRPYRATSRLKELLKAYEGCIAAVL